MIGALLGLLALAGDGLTVPVVRLQGGGSGEVFALRGDPSRRTICTVGVADGRWLEVSVDEAEITPVRQAKPDEVPADALVGGLGHEDLFVVASCEEILRAHGTKASGALVGGFRSASGQVRWRALRLFAEAPDPRRSSSVRAMLSDPDERVRRYALGALGSLAVRDIVPISQRLLEWDRSALVQHEAAVQLGDAGDYLAIDSLLGYLESPEPERNVGLACHRALRLLTMQRFGRDTAAWRAWWTNRREAWLARQREERGS